MRKSNFIKYICGFLMVLVLISCAPFAIAEEAVPETQAQSVMIVSLNTGATIYKKNSDRRIYPASTTKLMTMAVAIDMIEDLDEEITFDKDAAYFDLVIGSSNMGLKDGEVISLNNLFYGIALSSANEGTNMLGIHLCGSAEAFVAKMNEQAKAWGMKNTHFVNTHGLTDENHYTTAEDMAILAKHAFANERLLPYLSAGSYRLPATNKNPERLLISTNQLLRPNSGNFYKYAVAGKTGSTSAAGYNLISMARYKGMEYIAIAMNAPYGDNNPVFEDSTALFKWAFTNFSMQPMLTAKESVCEIGVELCAKSDFVMLTPEEPIEAVIKDDSNVEEYKVIDLAAGLDAEARGDLRRFMEENPKQSVEGLGAAYAAWVERALIREEAGKNADAKALEKAKSKVQDREELILAKKNGAVVDKNFKKGMAAEGEEKYLWFIITEATAYAPVAVGDAFGLVIIAERDASGALIAEYGRTDLVAATEQERSTILYYLYLIRNLFANIYVRIAVIVIVLAIIAYIILMIRQNKRRRRRKIARRIKF